MQYPAEFKGQRGNFNFTWVLAILLVSVSLVSLPATLTSAQQGNSPASRSGEKEPLDGLDGRPLELSKFQPRSMLKVANSHLTRAKMAVVDVHVHPRYKLHHSPQGLDAYTRLMDAQNIAVNVSLDGGLGSDLQEHKEYLWTKYKDRFVIFSNIGWIGDGDPNDPATSACHRSDFARRTVQQLREAKKMGISGVKIFKRLGLSYRNPDGSLVKIDDPRWDPIWHECGELGLVVLIHSADPAAFFDPIDQYNERREELRRHPDWSFYGPGWPSREDILQARNRVIARHPNTTFIGAHVANNPEDLAMVGQWLDTYPNLYVEIAARVAELGRQPKTARKFFLKYSDRIMFGTDGPLNAERLPLHWRFLETDDEYFPYATAPFPPQGLWRIYGISLPEVVLRKVYQGNAARVIPGVSERLEQYRLRAAKSSASSEN